MGFFTRKPNPSVPARAAQVISAILGSPTASPAMKTMALNAANKLANPPTGAAGPVGPTGQPGVAGATSEGAQQQAPSNTRFRSFCERYIVERCRDWKEGEIDERAWATILEAKSIYNKVREVGRTLTNDT